MILVISDTHCCYSVINDQIQHAEAQMGATISQVIHLGDFGIFKPDLRRYFVKEKNRFTHPVYFIEGNHEDFDILPWTVKKYQDHFTHLKRGSIHKIDSYCFLAIGGAGYMDAMLTQHGAVISDSDIDHCLKIPRDEIDIIISHDCPINIGVPNTKGLEYYGETGFNRSDEIDQHFSPKLWLFGHHHKWHEYSNHHTRYYGLPAAWRGYGLLDDGYRFELVKNEIPLPDDESYFDQFLKKIGFARPNLPQN